MSSKITSRRRAAIGALAMLAVVVLVGCSSDEPAALAGIERTPQPVVGDQALPDASVGDEAFALSADDGEVLVVYFGYTSCPDVCPTTLADLRKALADLDDDAESVDVAMVTVDPDRDTAEVLTGYVQSFVNDAHSLRTDDDEALQAAAEAFGASYSVTTAEDGEIEVAHTGFLYAVDDQGQLILTWPFGTPSEDLGNDLGILIKEVQA